MNTVDERFWAKVDRRDPDHCWEWTGAISRTGYSNVRIHQRTLLAHRVAYEALVGPIPPELVIDHLCRNRACVNPKHLEPVTFRENILRGEGEAARHARKTHCVNGHPFDAPGRKPGWRRCRACARISKAAYKARQKALR